MEFFSDGTFSHQGDGQPSPMVFAIMAGLQKVIDKKKKQQEEDEKAKEKNEEHQSPGDESDSSTTLVLNGSEPPLKAKSVDPAASSSQPSSQPNVDEEVKDDMVTDKEDKKKKPRKINKALQEVRVTYGYQAHTLRVFCTDFFLSLSKFT